MTPTLPQLQLTRNAINALLELALDHDKIEHKQDLISIAQTVSRIFSPHAQGGKPSELSDEIEHDRKVSLLINDPHARGHGDLPGSMVGG